MVGSEKIFAKCCIGLQGCGTGGYIPSVSCYESLSSDQRTICSARRRSPVPKPAPTGIVMLPVITRSKHGLRGRHFAAPRPGGLRGSEGAGTPARNILCVLSAVGLPISSIFNRAVVPNRGSALQLIGAKHVNVQLVAWSDTVSRSLWGRGKHRQVAPRRSAVGKSANHQYYGQKWVRRLSMAIITL